MAETDTNPKRRAQDQRQGREGMERRSTGTQTGADGGARQRDAGRFVGTAISVGQNKKPDEMHQWNGVLYWSRAQGRDEREQPEMAWSGAVPFG